MVAALALAAMPLLGFAQDPAGSTDNIVDNDTPVRLNSKIGKRDGVIIAQDDNSLACVSTSKLNGDSAIWLVYKNQELGRVYILNYATETFLGSDGAEARLFDSPRALRLFTATDDVKRAMIIDTTNGGLLALPGEFNGTNLIAETDSAKAIVTISIGTSDSKITPDGDRVRRLQDKCSTAAVTQGAVKVMNAFIEESRAAAQPGMEAFVGVPKVDALASAIKRNAPLDELEALYEEAQASVYPQPGHYYRFINIARPTAGSMDNILTITADGKYFKSVKHTKLGIGASGDRAEDLALFTVDSDPSLPSLVQISPAALNDMWLNNWGNTSVSTKENAHNFSLDRRDESPYHFRMVRTDNGLYLTVGGAHNLTSWGLDEESEWFVLKEIKEIPLTLDASGIASVTLPCPVGLPAGVQAYVALSASPEAVEVMTIGSTIPAKTPVIIKGEPKAELNLTVLNGDYSLSVNNILTGTTIKPSEGESRYAGALDDNGYLCFKKVRSSNVNANEAYLPSAVVEGAGNMIPTDLNTGIEEVAADKLSGVEGIFDLQGRRVASPSKGQVYIINGAKVLVK